jgi:hypothetical protein
VAPAVLFNATRVDDGPFAIATVDRGVEDQVLRLARRTAASAYPGNGGADLGDLSFRDPIAAPAAGRAPGIWPTVATSTSGVVGVAWTDGSPRPRHPLSASGPCCGATRRLREDLAAEPLSSPGWFFSSLGPLQATLKVRSNSQRVRRDEEIERLREAMSLVPGEHPELVVATLRPQSRGRTDPPLSWHLSEADSRRLCDDWRMARLSEDMALVRRTFGVAGDVAASPAEDCPLPY